MPPVGPVAKHIVGRVLQARRLDPTLTFKQAASELGISVSSLSKLRAGTRTGLGTIRERVIAPPTRAKGQPQVVSNAFNVRFESADGKRVASRTINVSGGRTRADALLMRHDPKIKRAIQKQLAKEESAIDRQVTGSPRWRRRERQELQVVSVTRVVRSDDAIPTAIVQYQPSRS